MMTPAEASDLRALHERVLLAAKDLYDADLAYRRAVREMDAYLHNLEDPKQ